MLLKTFQVYFIAANGVQAYRIVQAISEEVARRVLRDLFGIATVTHVKEDNVPT